MPLRDRRRLRVLGRLGRHLSARLVAASALLFAALIGTEIAGRRTTSDLDDALLGLALAAALLLAALLAGRDRRPLLRSVRATWDRLAGRLQGAWPQVGLAFRPDPTVPTRTPPLVRRAMLALLALTVLAVGWALLAPWPLREVLAPHAYLLHLTLTVATWAGLLLATLLGLMLGWLTARHAAWLGGHPRRRARWIFGAALLAVACAGFLLPIEVPFALALLAVGVGLFTPRLARIPRLDLLWRTSGDGTVAATSFGALFGHLSALPMAAFVLFVGMALGGTWSSAPRLDSSTPLTDGMARIAILCLGPAFLTHALAVVFDLRRLARSAPSTPCPTTLHVVPETSTDQRGVVAAVAGTRGWLVRSPPDAPRPTDVRLRLVDSPMPRPLSGWPLAVSARALEVPELLDLIERRDVVQRRRLLRRGLRRLLKQLRSRNYDRGEGFWIAPHLWYVSGVTRDTEEEDLSEDGLNHELGTPYARLLPLPVRHHLHVVLLAAVVDIILLEDGVRWSAFRQVLDRIFAHYDAGRGRIEERDFHGLVGVRVILHDLEPGGQLEVEGYPEPDYTDLARARILHVFKDRGGLDDETEPVPSEDTGVLLAR